ncbi:MAG: RNA-binding cell elongation regulator Jag/EloR [Fervidobacterium sp.]|uniref:RNA-binding protein KhpB n=1 Tax=Fervidobacterium gondwanense DSM 13020 TaxID=1121883 RepID=A0A1M7SLM7_FERGO|nr:RNA-binding cell elongation regulator Jag/EloR [Fervidobacterium gondwanense]UXF01501.1 single-stranded DNA-binding protein [Fervidobacterium riparium]SHN59328.1 spoIIIJ-associated protein [Fervidobacterium gondwanense DSM 13020]
MKTLNYVGKSVDEIIEQFRSEYDVLDKEYDVNIIDKGTHGIFGLFSRDAVVEITISNKYYERKLKEFLEEIFKRFGVDYYVEVASRGKTFIATCHSEDIGKVIGKHGKGLGALQHLANIFLNRITDTKVTVIIDAGNYREKRKEQLERIVEMAVEKAKKSGKVKLDPMFAFERKLVHEIAKKFRDVHTYSEGLEPYRYVVIEAKRGGKKNEDRRHFKNATA